MNILWLLFIGLIVGWLAGQIMHGRGFGLVGDIIIGILGSLIGGFLFSLLGIAAYGMLGTIVMGVVGAIVLIFLLRMIRHP